MCFSATASLATASLLLAAGAYCVKKSSTKGEHALAMLPIFFSLQQFFEGFIWLHLTDRLSGTPPACLSDGFIFIANVIWPIWVPATVLMLETNNLRRKILWLITSIGAVVSVYLFINIFSGTIIPQIQNHHILYNFYEVSVYPYTKYIYLSVISLALILSSHKWLSVFGLIILATFILTSYIAKENYISVWCFFAAFFSAILCLYYKSKDTKNITSSFTK